MFINLSKKIYDLRREKGYTQEKLAEMLGVSTAAVSKWETDNAYPDITLLPSIAEIFNVSLDYLFGYDITAHKTVSEIIAEANKMSKDLNRDGAVSLIEKTLARYPNDSQLIFELARHKFVNARYKNKKERDTLLKEAAEGFESVTKLTENENRRAWAYHFLTSISVVVKEYDKARSWNSKIIGGVGVYPRVDRAIIEMSQHCNKNAMQVARETMYGSIFEYSLLIDHIVHFHFQHNEPDNAIDEVKRAVSVLDAFNDSGLFTHNIAILHEDIALAYAIKRDCENCLLHLEKAYDYAEEYDAQDNNFVYNVYGIMGETVETEERISARKLLLRTLNSDERTEYDAVRDSERYREIVRKLTECVS